MVTIFGVSPDDPRSRPSSNADRACADATDRLGHGGPRCHRRAADGGRSSHERHRSFRRQLDPVSGDGSVRAAAGTDIRAGGCAAGDDRRHGGRHPRVFGAGLCPWARDLCDRMDDPWRYWASRCCVRAVLWRSCSSWAKGARPIGQRRGGRRAAGPRLRGPRRVARGCVTLCYVVLLSPVALFVLRSLSERRARYAYRTNHPDHRTSLLGHHRRAQPFRGVAAGDANQMGRPDRAVAGALDRRGLRPADQPQPPVSGADDPDPQRDAAAAEGETAGGGDAAQGAKGRTGGDGPAAAPQAATSRATGSLWTDGAAASGFRVCAAAGAVAREASRRSDAASAGTAGDGGDHRRHTSPATGAAPALPHAGDHDRGADPAHAPGPAPGPATTASRFHGRAGWVGAGVIPLRGRRRCRHAALTPESDFG
jgi:hypothetical protein